MGRLDGNVAMITGASRGIGRAVAVAFAAEGADIAIVGVTDETALAGVEQNITAQGRRVIAVLADVSQRAEIDRLVNHIAEEWGHLDILVNNAGIIRPTPLEDISEEQWDRTIAVHLKGTFNCTQAVLAIMKRQGGVKSSMSPRHRRCAAHQVSWIMRPPRVASSPLPRTWPMNLRPIISR